MAMAMGMATDIIRFSFFAMKMQKKLPVGELFEKFWRRR
jgi:hypothetical protein